MYPTHNTLSENIRAQSAGLLNLHLAAGIDRQLWFVESHAPVKTDVRVVPK